MHSDHALTTLTGKNIRLESFSEAHRNELYQAAQDEQIWKYQPNSALGEHFSDWFNNAIKMKNIGEEKPFVVRRLMDDKIVGSTRFYNIDRKNCGLTIGYTWYIPEVWGSYVNPESKYLLLEYAFEKTAVNRVEFRIDARNMHSRAAVNKLGAKEEGILRQHMVLPDGHIRDTVVFSIVSTEWPEVRQGLLSRL